jgi:hypothetical protein
MADRNALFLDPTYDDQTGLGGYGAVIPGDSLNSLMMPTKPYRGFAGGILGSSAGAGMGAIAAGRYSRVPGALLGASLGFIPGVVSDIMAGGDQYSGSPNLPSDRYPAREYLDHTGSVLPPLSYQTQPPIKPPGWLSGLYEPLDRVTRTTDDALSQARAEAAKGRQSPIGSAIGYLMANGAQGLAELPGAALRTVSAPVDAVTGHQVDMSLGDAVGVSLAGAGAAYRGTKALREKGLEDAVSNMPPPMSSFSGYPTAHNSNTIYNALLPEAETAALTAKGYRGSVSGEMRFSREGSQGPWASDQPKVAATYAKEYSNAPSIAPLEFRFDKPFVIDAKGKQYNAIDVPGTEFKTYTDTIAEGARAAGHDGVVFKNIYDSAHDNNIPSTVYHALKRGTTYSPMTGELLYGLAPAAAVGLSDDEIRNSLWSGPSRQ